MANIKSAKKRVRQTKRRTLANRMRVGRIRTLLRQHIEADDIACRARQVLIDFRAVDEENRGRQVKLGQTIRQIGRFAVFQ